MNKEQYHEQQSILRRVEDFDWVCHDCSQDIDPFNESFEIEYSDSNKTKEVMYHTICFNRNPDEPDIFVEHKI